MQNQIFGGRPCIFSFLPSKEVQLPERQVGECATTPHMRHTASEQMYVRVILLPPGNRSTPHLRILHNRNICQSFFKPPINQCYISAWAKLTLCVDRSNRNPLSFAIDGCLDIHGSEHSILTHFIHHLKMKCIQNKLQRFDNCRGTNGDVGLVHAQYQHPTFFVHAE